MHGGVVVKCCVCECTKKNRVVCVGLELGMLLPRDKESEEGRESVVQPLCVL